MKCYFTASIAAKDKYIANYIAIVECLKKNSISVQADHILDITESQVHLQTKEQRLAFHDKLKTWITTADFMVVEASFPSISVGYEIALALQSDIPVLVLYTQEYPPALMAFHKNEKLVCEKYTKDSLPEIIEEFIQYAHSTHDTRFTFFITPRISAFLDEVSKKSKVPKSVYLRRLIEREMQKST